MTHRIGDKVGKIIWTYKVKEDAESMKDDLTPIDEVTGKVFSLQSTMFTVEKDIADLKRQLSRVANNLNAYMNRVFAEINVVEDDGKWGDYSGNFYPTDEENSDLVIERARVHFKKYFKDGVNHQKKKLGLFLVSPRSGKRLIEEMTTGE